MNNDWNTLSLNLRKLGFLVIPFHSCIFCLNWKVSSSTCFYWQVHISPRVIHDGLSGDLFCLQHEMLFSFRPSGCFATIAFMTETTHISLFLQCNRMDWSQRSTMYGLGWAKSLLADLCYIQKPVRLDRWLRSPPGDSSLIGGNTAN